MEAVIRPGRDVFTLINTFEVLPDNAVALADSLQRFTEAFAQGCAGFVSASVHLGLDRTRVVNYVQWRRQEDLGAMMAKAAYQQHLQEVRSLALRITPAFYEVVYVGGQPA